MTFIVTSYYYRFYCIRFIISILIKFPLKELMSFFWRAKDRGCSPTEGLPIFFAKNEWREGKGRDGFRRKPEKRARQNRREPNDRRRSPRRMVWRYDKTYFLYASPHFHKYAKTVTAAGDIGTFTVFHRHYIPRKQSATRSCRHPVHASKHARFDKIPRIFTRARCFRSKTRLLFP